MMGPTRYDSTLEFDGDDFFSYMEERPKGDYVTYDDYEELQNKYDDLKERIYDIYRSV